MINTSARLGCFSGSHVSRRKARLFMTTSRECQLLWVAQQAGLHVRSKVDGPDLNQLIMMVFDTVGF